MFDNKICFITCVNNEEMYKICLNYLQSLVIPKNMVIDFIGIRNAKSITKGYNKGMNISDSKYKIYLHQDVYIQNKNFIKEILNAFVTDESIGMVGIIGAKSIPNSGIWWESKDVVGKVIDNHTGKMSLINFDYDNDKYEYVKAVDGLLMATQYDIEWREDLFDGWHFYDISQCCEFINQNKKIIVPKQDTPWCIHDCGIVNLNGYNKYRDIFIKHYL